MVITIKEEIEIKDEELNLLEENCLNEDTWRQVQQNGNICEQVQKDGDTRHVQQNGNTCEQVQKDGDTRQVQQNKDIWQQGQQDLDNQLSNTVHNDFDNEMNEHPLKIRVEENQEPDEGELMKIKAEKEEMDGDHRFLDCQENDHLLDPKVEIDSQQAVNQELKKVEEDPEIQFRRLRESKFPIVLLKKLNLEDIKISIADTGLNCKKESSALNVKNKHDIQKDEDNHTFEEEAAEDEIKDKDKMEIMFRRLQESTFPIILLKKLNLKDEKFQCDGEFKEWSSTPTTSISRPLNIRSNDERIMKDSEVIATKKDSEFVVTKKQEYLRGCKIGVAPFEAEGVHFKGQIHFKSKKIFKCFKCNFESRDKGSLKFHLLKHSKSKLLSCSTCNYKTNRKDNLNIHILNHLNIKYFRCLVCSYRTNKKSHLKKHLNIHSKENQRRRWPGADAKFQSYWNAFINKTTTDLKTELFACSKCGLKFRQKNSLKIHLLNHLGLKVIQCPYCSYRTNCPSNFRRHKFTHEPSPSPSSKLFTCSDCDFSCNRKDNLKTHILFQHTDIKPFKCSGCSFTTHRKDALKIHENKHKFHSTNCTSGKNSKSILEHKSASPSTSKADVCHYSSPRTNNKDNSSSYNCSECSFVTSFKLSLKRHIFRWHVNPKSFKCTICSHKTNDRTDFSKHLFTHEQMKKLKCPHCLYVATTKTSLNGHLTSHLAKDLECSHCHYVTNHKGNLKKHIKRHHNSLE